jgi:hypothetical protein
MMTKEDQDQLKLLSIFHYVLGVFTALVSFVPVIHLTIGLVMLFSPQTLEPSGGENQEGLRIIGGIFVGVAMLVILVGFGFALCMILVGRFLNHRTHYIFCMVVAALECLSFPFGTVLGVFTIVVLSRESVKQLFGRGSPQSAIAPL